MKASQAEAHYRDNAGMRQCKDCAMFQPPSGCSSVSGAISPNGTCDYFERKKMADHERMAKMLMGHQGDDGMME